MKMEEYIYIYGSISLSEKINNCRTTRNIL